MQSNNHPRYFLIIIGVLQCCFSFGQTPVEGYVFENNNRGYLKQASITVFKLPGKTARTTITTDEYGYFKLNLPPGKYRLLTHKDMFDDRQDTILVGSEKLFLKMEVLRNQGFFFDATLTTSGTMTDSLRGAQIEIYNRTLDQPELELKKHPFASFQFPFEQGNHYLLLIRKPGYISKRIEVDLHTNGCPLCFDRLYDFDQLASTDLAIDYEQHRITAHLQLEPAVVGKRLRIPIKYGAGADNQWLTQKESLEVLDKVVLLLQDNPGLSVEIGSYTDARGNDAYNLEMSQNLANSVAAYITVGGISADRRITAKGYGETQLVNKCGNGVPCTEAEHQQNRRTELLITGAGSVDDQESLQWMTIEQIIEEEKIAARTKEEVAKGAKSIKPMSTGPAEQQLPEANNSVPLPEFNGKVIESGMDVEEEAPSSGAPVRRADAVHSNPNASHTKLIPMDTVYAGYAIQLIRSAAELNASYAAFKSFKDIYWTKEFDGMYYYYLLPKEPVDQMRKYYRKTVKPNHRDARLLRFDVNGKVYLK